MFFAAECKLACKISSVRGLEPKDTPDLCSEWMGMRALGKPPVSPREVFVLPVNRREPEVVPALIEGKQFCKLL